MTTIFPAILTDNKEVLLSRYKQFDDIVPVIHIDIMDGQYVPSKSVEVKDVFDVLHTFDVQAKVQLHMMAMEPVQYLEAIDTTMLDSVILHVDSTKDIMKSIDAYKTYTNVSLCFPIAKTLTPDLTQYESLVDGWFVLSIAKQGYSGEPFSDTALTQIAHIRSNGDNKHINVDGGIDLSTVSLCLAAGADQFVINSAIFKTDDPISAYRTFTQL